VGIIAVAGFALGIAWPRLAGIKVGPAVPADLRAQVDPGAAPPGSATPRTRPSASASAGPSASASASADAEGDAPPPNQEMVVVGAGRIVKCSDKKDKKIDDCEKLLFDPIAVKRLRELSRCPSAVGLTAKLTVGFEVDFKKKEVGVKKSKKDKTSLPSSTVSGILQCAAKEFGNVSLEEVPHKHRSYTLEYVVNFYGPGKHPDAAPTADTGDGEPSAGSTTSEADASGSAVVAWDTALLRKDPKDGEVVARLVRGTKVKILGKQGDWYKIESGAKTGWVYRGTIGL